MPVRVGSSEGLGPTLAAEKQDRSSEAENCEQTVGSQQVEPMLRQRVLGIADEPVTAFGGGKQDTWRDWNVRHLAIWWLEQECAGVERDLFGMMEVPAVTLKIDRKLLGEELHQFKKVVASDVKVSLKVRMGKQLGRANATAPF